MFLAMCALGITWGILCITDRELVWTIYQLDARVFRKRDLRKGPYWRANMRYQGIALILLGIIGVMTTLGYTL